MYIIKYVYSYKHIIELIIIIGTRDIIMYCLIIMTFCIRPTTNIIQTQSKQVYSNPIISHDVYIQYTYYTLCYMYISTLYM